MILQTKIAPTPDPDEFVAHVDESLVRLRTDRIDLLAIHGVNTFQKLWLGGPARRVPGQPPDGCRSRARCGHVGLSTHGSPDLIRSAIETPVFGGFDYVNLHWYFIIQRNWPAIEAAASAATWACSSSAPRTRAGVCTTRRTRWCGCAGMSTRWPSTPCSACCAPRCTP